MNSRDNSPHLFVDISAHGLGHLAQTAPVLNALRQRLPELRLTLRSDLPEHRLRARIHGTFAHIAATSDFGYVMHDATEIDLPASAAAYRTAHAHWPSRVTGEADFLRALAPDLVLSNVAYLPLAGAKAAGIPSIAMCSLNWADLFAHFFADAPWASAVQSEIDEAYTSAPFMRLTPAMPMPRLTRLINLTPVAEPAHTRRTELREALGGSAETRLVLIAFGGIQKHLPLDEWPHTPGVQWLNGAVTGDGPAALHSLSALPWTFSEILASVDAVLTKPGYGTFVEAACAGIPVLYVRRPDWPEQDALIDWLHANTRAHEIEESTLLRGEFTPSLHALWDQAPPQCPVAEGAAQAADVLYRSLTKQ